MPEPRYDVVDTWNGGQGGRRVRFTGTHDECVDWIHHHTSFSIEMARHQGLAIQRGADAPDEDPAPQA